MESLPIIERMEEQDLNLELNQDSGRTSENDVMFKESIEKDNSNEKQSIENESNKKNNKDRKVQNLRKNIKDLLENTQLDEATLAAQKLESERLSR